ncbi:hypothetical protein SAMN05216563_103305 [Phytobacter palmae]|uniref:Uncharacterized protein n=1 Tax=Phytobacter palmae TaxID=1855371 RepID=A0ABU9V9G0_9ENTR|nr:hypothetical protein [Escherichia coli]SFE15160.1 hypothetical protein SAMN05216563_103305 [Phytobacter palmae]
MKKYIIGLLAIMPLSVLASSPDCHSWPMNMAEAWMKNAGIVDLANLDESKTEIKQLASEKKGKDLYTQIYHFVFHDKSGGQYEVITQSDASSTECSISEVNSFLVTKKDLTH